MSRRRKIEFLLGILFVGLPLVLMTGVRYIASNVAYAEYQGDRMNMVEEQLVKRGIDSERVLDAFRKVPRHRFVPEEWRTRAYTDGPLPIGHDQTISQPYIVAYMTQVVEPDKGDRILEIGTGSGYQAAILAQLVQEVYTVEIIPELAKTAERRFEALGYENITTRVGDGYQGWPKHAPFDIIIVTAAPSEVPPPLVEQLKEGGRMVIPVGEQYEQKLHVYEKTNGELQQIATEAVRFVPLMDIEGNAY